jgi:hypothetical protein
MLPTEGRGLKPLTSCFQVFVQDSVLPAVLSRHEEFDLQLERTADARTSARLEKLYVWNEKCKAAIRFNALQVVCINLLFIYNHIYNMPSSYFLLSSHDMMKRA